MRLQRVGVGVYGTSAGGQNAMAAMLFHGDFYKAAVAKRLSRQPPDKIWERGVDGLADRSALRRVE